MNPRCAPERIRQTHSTNEGSELWIDRGPATATASAPPAPVEPEPLSVPADDGLRLDDDEHLFPAAPSAAEHGPEGSIKVGEGWPRRHGLEDRELMPKSQVLEGELASRLESGRG